jgi:hypothetical protein
MNSEKSLKSSNENELTLEKLYTGCFKKLYNFESYTHLFRGNGSVLGTVTTYETTSSFVWDTYGSV